VTLLLSALGGYIVLCVVLYFSQERFIFFPEELEPGYVYTFPVPFEEVTLPADGAALNALHFRAAQPQGVILYLHGNAGSLRVWGELGDEFVALGYDVLIVDYRGYGKSSGRISSERDLHDDAATAYAYLQRRYPEDEIIVYGRSLGTGLAVHLARANRPKMLILETPYFNLLELAKASVPFIPGFLFKYTLRTDQWIADVTCPVYLFHGTRDELIPYNSSLRLAQLIEAEHQLFTIEGGMHNDLGAFEQYHEALARILE
jgi:fermentation-respiration switch protein FrsA (DUF1100 family)